MSALGPLLETLGTVTKGVTVNTAPEVRTAQAAQRRDPRWPSRRPPGAGDRGAGLRGDPHAVRYHQRPGRGARASARRGAHRASSSPISRWTTRASGSRSPTPRPGRCRSSPAPEWSGSEHGGRRYTAFTINVERLKPWHTLTGRQHFFLDHDWMTEIGEQLPTFRPPFNMHRLYGDQGTGEGREVTVRYLTPHSKWSIHSEYQDNLFMLSLSRGGPEIWMSPQDADAIGVKDNDWIEAYNRNGVVVARAIVSHRMPAGTVYMYHAKDRTVDVPAHRDTRACAVGSTTR